jgi:hypothetical protein
MRRVQENNERKKKNLGLNEMKKRNDLLQGISLACLGGMLIFSILIAGCTDTGQQPETPVSTVPTTTPVKHVTTTQTTVVTTTAVTTVAPSVSITLPQGKDQNPQYTNTNKGQGSGSQSSPSAQGTPSMDMLKQMASDLKSKGYDVSGLEKAIDANDQSTIQSWFQTFMKEHPEAMQR